MNTKSKKETKKFNVEELETRLEMATIQGTGTTTDSAGTNNGCKANKSCTQDNW
jgi:hypothetical protein